jgi:hypothetical protein
MTEPSIDPSTNLPLNGPEAEGEDKVRELAGERRVEDQQAFIDRSDTDSLNYNTATELYEGEPGDSLENADSGDRESLEMLTELELRADETDDVMQAVEEGYTYVPPIDPPTMPSASGDYENAVMASGFGVSSLDEPYNQDTHSDLDFFDDEINARVREAIRADSSTTAYADRIAIEVTDGVVTLRGMVEDLDDSDNLIAVAQYVEGVIDVDDQLRIRTLER